MGDVKGAVSAARAAVAAGYSDYLHLRDDTPKMISSPTGTTHLVERAELMAMSRFPRSSRISSQVPRSRRSVSRRCGMRRLIPMTLLVVLLVPYAAAASPAEGAAEPHRSAKGRVIGTLAGIGGGFLLGLIAGFAWFDDATYSDRKVTTTVVLFSAAGGVGGYLIGSAIDHRGSATRQVKSSRPLPMPRTLPRLRQPEAPGSRFFRGLFDPRRCANGVRNITAPAH